MGDLPRCNAEARRSRVSDTKRGGWITFPFMIGTLLCLSIASWGWMQNLIVFLINEFNMKSIAAAKINNIVNGCVNLFIVIEALIADSLFGTIPVIIASTLISLVGVVLLTLTVSFDSLKPQPCEKTSNLCESPSKLQLGILYIAITLASVRASLTLATTGANQYDKLQDQRSFFNWFFFSIYLATVISATAIVYVEDNVGWKLGFGLCVAAKLLGVVIFLLGKRFYRQDKPLGSPFTSLIRVVVAAIRKRNVMVSSNQEDYHQEYCDDATIATTIPTNSFRFFNRAAFKTGDDTKPDGLVRNPWRLCSVEQVEDLKSIIRILPIVLATLFLSTTIGVLVGLIVLQALAMDRQISPHFKIPAGSIGVLAQITSCIFVALNDRFVYPMYQKITHKPLTLLQRIGIGHVFNILSLAIAAIVEVRRLKVVQNHRFLQSSSVAPMSVLWLLPQLVIFGIGEAFYFPGNVGLYYQEFPASLKTTATSMTSFMIGICFYLSAALINLIQKTTSWLPDDINH